MNPVEQKAVIKYNTYNKKGLDVNENLSKHRGN